VIGDHVRVVMWRARSVLLPDGVTARIDTFVESDLPQYIACA
jgi:hypothetical protein